MTDQDGRSGGCPHCPDGHREPDMMGAVSPQIPALLRFRKKPVVIEAMKFTTNNEVGSPAMDRIVNWVNQGRQDAPGAWHNGTDIYIRTLEGEMCAMVGDWIIRDVQGEFYPCKPDIFEATYEPA